MEDHQNILKSTLIICNRMADRFQPKYLFIKKFNSS